MKHYKREYEYVFSNPKPKNFDINDITVFGNAYDRGTYFLELKKLFGSFENEAFQHLIKIYWLFSMFCYKGRRRLRGNKNGTNVDGAFSTMMKNVINHDTKFFFGGNSSLFKLTTYIYDFFPDFDIHSPFEYTYEYPYKYMNFECLYFVHRMNERLELLAEGEKQKMSYVKFLDYVINYISCYNEEHGEKYVYKFPYNFSAHYVKNLESYLYGTRRKAKV